jgi:hypothetical protein
MVAVADDLEPGANAGGGRVQAEVEADLGHEPVGRAIILAPDGDVRG